MIAVLVTSAGIWLASAFVEGRVRVAFWAVAMLVEIVVAFAPSSRERFAAVPLQLHHLPERFGLFTIIVLGETVLAVVVGVAHAHWAASAAVFGAVGLTISFSLWWIYFESVSARAFTYSEWFRPLTWVLAHAPFVIAVTALGVGIEIAVLTEFGEQLPVADALLLSGSLVVALVAIAVLLMTGVPSRQWGRLVLWRIPAIASVLLIGLLPIAAQGVLASLALVAAVQAMVDVRTNRMSVSDTS
jgi:low temperature requirement protein LtrA